MIVHNFDPVLIDLGLIQIRWYSIAYILGIILGWIYANKIIRKTEKNKVNFKPIKMPFKTIGFIYFIIKVEVFCIFENSVFGMFTYISIPKIIT